MQVVNRKESLHEAVRSGRVPVAGDAAYGHFDAVAMLFLGLIQPSSILWHLSAGKYDVTKQSEAA